MKKIIYTFALLLCVQTIFAQEQNPPIAVPGQASEHLTAFENAVIYLADKKKSRTARESFAKSFAKSFNADAKIQVMNGKKKETLEPLAYFFRLINLNYDAVKISFVVNKQTNFSKNQDGWWTTQYELVQTFEGKRNGHIVVADFTIKTIDLFLLYENGGWTVKYGNVLAHYSQRIDKNFK